MSKLRNITDWTEFIKNEADKALTEEEVKAEIFKIAHDFEIDTRFDTEHLNRDDYEELETIFNSSIGAIHILQDTIEYRVFERVDKESLRYMYDSSNENGAYVIDFDYLQSQIEDWAVDNIAIHTYENMTDEEYNKTIEKTLSKVKILNGGNFIENNNTLSVFNKAARTLDVYAHIVIMKYEAISSDTDRLESYETKDDLIYLCNESDACIQNFKVIEQNGNEINILGVEDSTASFLGNYSSKFHNKLTKIIKKIGIDSSFKVIKILEEIRKRACKVESNYSIDDEGNEFEEEIAKELSLPYDLVLAFDKIAGPIVKETKLSNADKQHSIKEISTYMQNNISQKLFKISNGGLSKDICLKVGIRYADDKAFKKYKNSLGNKRRNSLEVFESTDKITDAYEVLDYAYNDNPEILAEAIYNLVNSIKKRGFKVSLQIGTDSLAEEKITVLNKAELKDVIDHMV